MKEIENSRTSVVVTSVARCSLAGSAQSPTTRVQTRFRVFGLIGTGGIGDVYAAEYLETRRACAIKILKPPLRAKPDSVCRFVREATILARFRSRYIVDVIALGWLPDDTPCIVMEWLLGQDLRRLLDCQRRLPSCLAAKLIYQACLGICAMHAAHLRHGDLKPANLFIQDRGHQHRDCKLLDLGAAVSWTDPQPRPIAGTLRYMAPEQLQNTAIIDPRADLYAVGTVLYECLAGHPPFLADSLERVLFAIMHDDAPRLDQLVCDVPRGLAAVVSKALARRASERFSSAEELAAALAPFAQSTRGSRRL